MFRTGGGPVEFKLDKVIDRDTAEAKVECDEVRLARGSK